MKINIINKDFVEVEQRYIKVEGSSGLIGITESSGSNASCVYQVVSKGDLKGKYVLAFMGSIQAFNIGLKKALLLNKKDVLAECVPSKRESIITPAEAYEEKSVMRKNTIAKGIF